MIKMCVINLIFFNSSNYLIYFDRIMDIIDEIYRLNKYILLNFVVHVVVHVIPFS